MELPLTKVAHFRFKKLNSFLKKENMYMFINFHENSKPKYSLKFSNIIIINKEKYPFFDSTLFLKISDMLINDCSTITTEACLINLPQIYDF